MRILLVEDDPQIASFVVKGLTESGHCVSCSKTGEDGFQHATTGSYDILIIDLMLPGIDGLSLIEQLRHQGMKTPLIIVSAKRTVDDRVRGLQAGGDDYLTKPFAFSELLARIQALSRRTSVTVETPRLNVGDLQMDLETLKVTRDGKNLDLQPREHALLAYLMRNVGKVVSRTMIMEHVWGYNFDPGTNVVDARVCMLREKVDKDAKYKLIHTIRGVGYVLRQDS